MNKQIIDGVDVSGCNFTIEQDGKIKCECTHATGFGVICDCESWKTCHYKKYKRKEQKLERIRELLINITEAGLCEAKECGCDDNKECLECTLNEIKDVIQIIDKVENGRKIL